MLEGAPPSLDHRVGLGYLDLGEHAAKTRGKEGGIDGDVDVLDARVGHERRPDGDRIKMPASLDEHPCWLLVPSGSELREIPRATDPLTGVRVRPRTP
jgi:hypothetical protein